MKFKQLIQDYFTFSRNERKGITILLVFIFLLAVTNRVIFYFETPARIDTILFDSARNELGLLNDSVNHQSSRKLFPFNPNTIDSIVLGSLDLPESVKRNLLKFRSKGGKFYSNTDFRKIYGVTDSIYLQVAPYILLKSESKPLVASSLKTELFMFDPNKTTDEEFRQLGLSLKQVTTIRNYQNKGGSFKDKKDFFKIWGLSEDQKKILADFIKIDSLVTTHLSKKTTKQNLQFDLNSSDSVQLKLLPGIGDKLSKRIVKYRDLLGGFYSVIQLKEVYGLSEQTILQIQDKVTVDITKIRKLDINFSDVNELSKHPYLQKNLARQIIKFRNKNGSIRDLDVLRDSMVLNIDDYNRLKPYF